MNRIILFPLFAVAALLFLPDLAEAQTVSSLDEARAALQANDLPNAEALLVPLTGVDSKDAVAFYTLGQLRERQSNLKEAVSAYEQASKIDATKPEYFSTLAVTLSKRMGEMNFMQQAMVAGKMKKAFEKSVELDPNHVKGLIGLVRYYVSAPEIAGGSTEKAAEFARRIRAIAPFQGEMELGMVASHDERYADALSHYEAAVKLNPAHGYVQYLCGQMLVKLDKKDEARTRFETALKLDPMIDAAKQALAQLDAPTS